MAALKPFTVTNGLLKILTETLFGKEVHIKDMELNSKDT